MSFAKWIGASIGWSFGGPIGAIIGLALGSLVDNSSGKPQTHKRMRAQTQPGDFEVSLLILASLVIKADGKQDQRELDFVRAYFVNMYGKDRVLCDSCHFNDNTNKHLIKDFLLPALTKQ